MNHPKNHSTDQRGLFIAPDMTMRAYLKKYPLATLFLNQHLADNRERLLDAPILEFLKVVKQRPGGFFMRDTLAGWMNNIAGAYYHAPLLHGQSDWLHTYGPAPAGPRDHCRSSCPRTASASGGRRVWGRRGIGRATGHSACSTRRPAEALMP